ncbi:MAG: hypothetical protein ACRETA_09000 [Gammaproteobacteria bacterium]
MHPELTGKRLAMKVNDVMVCATNNRLIAKRLEEHVRNGVPMSPTTKREVEVGHRAFLARHIEYKCFASGSSPVDGLFF